MDKKAVRELLVKEIEKLEKLCLTSTDACMVAKYIAIKDSKVQNLIETKIAEGYHFKEVRCLKTTAQTENMRVYFEFTCLEETAICLVPPSFLVLVNLETRAVVGEPRDHYTLKPYEILTTAATGLYNQFQPMAQLPVFGEFAPYTQTSYQPNFFPNYQPGYQPNWQATFPGAFQTSFQTGMMPMAQAFPQMQPMTFPRAMQAMIDAPRLMEMPFQGEEQNLPMWTPQARIIRTSPTSLRLIARILVPNSSYVAGVPYPGVPKDHEHILLPEQRGIILPIEHNRTPVSLPCVTNLGYELPFEATEAQTNIVVFATLDDKVIGYATILVPAAAQLQHHRSRILEARY
jgi:hypothetical protein